MTTAQTASGARAADHAGAAAALRAAGVAAALVGAAYLAWRWATPSECAWTGPAAQEWIAAGVRPSVSADCPLRPGDVVTGADVAGSQVRLLRGSADPAVLELVPSGAVVLQRLSASAWSIAFCLGFFALALYASLRRRGDWGAATVVVYAGALLGSTIVTMLGLPAHSSFAGAPLWAFMLATQPLFLLAWGAGLAWLLLFPTPIAGPRRIGRWHAAALAGPLVLWAAVAAPAALVADGFTAWMHASIVLQSSITVVTLAGTLALLAVRLRVSLRERPGSVPREQMLWIAGSASVTGLLVLALWLLPQLLTGRAVLPDEAIGAPGLLFVAGFGIAVVRYRMFDLDTVLVRTLVYAGLTLAVVLVYLVASAVLALGLGTVAPAQAAVIAAVLAALVLNPLRIRLERAVNRAFYGERDEPYAALSRIATEVSEGGTVDGRVVADIRKALRAPYVCIVRAEGGVLQSGDPRAMAAGSVDFPLQRAGAALGSLQLAVRGAGERYGSGERRLLGDIARQIGGGLHEEQLVSQLQRSREQLVLAREEERRALRRALHDDVGPTMAALAIRAETARRVLGSDPVAVAAADSTLKSIAADAGAAAEALRRLSYDLRPPALDEHGLAQAVSIFAAGSVRPAVGVESDLDDVPGRPALPAAVEAALYRIVVAAVDNAIRHADAETCSVRLHRTATHVEATVSDDGTGVPAGSSRGVGITSMMERAAELGGACTVTSSSPGTVVRVIIPTGGAA